MIRKSEVKGGFFLMKIQIHTLTYREAVAEYRIARVFQPINSASFENIYIEARVTLYRRSWKTPISRSPHVTHKVRITPFLRERLFFANTLPEL